MLCLLVNQCIGVKDKKYYFALIINQMSEYAKKVKNGFKETAIQYSYPLVDVNNY